jgi:phasin family protein
MAIETAQATAERLADTGAQSFKDSVDKSLTAFSDLNAQSKRNLEAMVASVTAATKGAESLSAQALAFAKKSSEENMAAVRSLTSAKSLQEAVELQSAFAKTAFDSYLSEVNRWSDTMSATFRESLRPLNERVSAAVEAFQAPR